MSVVLALLLGLSVLSGGDSGVDVPLWPHGNPDGWTRTDKETRTNNGVPFVNNVSHPTLTVSLVPGARAGTPLVIICPGGGYYGEAIEHEGSDIVKWLNGAGYHAALLKYRLPNRDVDRPLYKVSLQDLQRSVRLIRASASRFGTAVDRVGVLGFSAGGHLCATALLATTASYSSVDDADQQSFVPSFGVLVYPAYLDNGPLGDYPRGHLAPEIAVRKDQPPAILVQTLDDKDYVPGSITFADACRVAGASLEAHFFPHGGHGYGLRSQEPGLKEWPRLVETWLKARSG